METDSVDSDSDSDTSSGSDLFSDDSDGIQVTV